MRKPSSSTSLQQNAHRRKRKLSWKAVAALCLVLPTLLLTGPGYLGQWLLERAERRAAEKRVEQIEAKKRLKPLTDIAPPQRAPRVSEDEAPERRMAKAQARLRSQPSSFDLYSKATPPSVEGKLSHHNTNLPSTDGAANTDEPVRLAQPPPVKLPAHLASGRQVPRPTRVIHQPEFWPEAPDPFVKPNMQVDPRRHPEGH